VVTFIAALAVADGIGPVPLESPAGAYFLAYNDLKANVKHEDWCFTRYLALYSIPRDEREKAFKAVAFAVNGLSFSRSFAPMTLVGDGLLIRFDISRLGWDVQSRADRIAFLRKKAVTFAAGEVSADPWETLAKRDPYFEASRIVQRKPTTRTVTRAQVQVDAYGRQVLVNVPYTESVSRPPVLVRGWIDPDVFAAVAEYTHSAKAVLRADWFLYQTWTDRPIGLYSDFLLLPAKEKDLYKVLLIDEADQRGQALTVGGATREGTSFVALGPRELELLGGDLGFAWRTYDFDVNNVLKDVQGDRDPRQRFRGTVKHDGREIIYSLPNGLHGYYLANGQGVQVGEVPPTIARDQLKPDPESRVINAWKCVACHGPNDGLIPFKDSITPMLSGRSKLVVEAYDPRVVAIEIRKLADYYGENYAGPIDDQQAAYRRAIKKLNGLDSPVNAQWFIYYLETYAYGLVDRTVAQRELGVDAADLDVVLGRLGNPTNLVIQQGNSVLRVRWEQAFRDAANGVLVFPWEVKKKGEKGEKEGKP
jgi:hypothetical protein